jgi:hypothetical protein
MNDTPFLAFARFTMICIFSQDLSIVFLLCKVHVFLDCPSVTGLDVEHYDHFANQW